MPMPEPRGTIGRRRLGLGTLLAALAASGGSPGAAFASAATYPDRPIRIINPFPAGSPVDFVGRLVAEKLRNTWNQPVVVESRSGAGGTIGTAYVAKAAPDGHTLLVATPSVVTTAPALFRSLPYDPVNDLVPLWLIVSGGLVMVVAPSVPARTVEEFLRHARANPGRVSYASAGPGSPQHLAAELFMARSGVRLEHVPYQGAVPALRDVMAGHVEVMFDNVTNVLPQLGAGRLRALGILRAQRNPALPEVPTMAEAGLAGVEVPGGIGFFAPAGVPADIVRKLSDTIAAVAAEPETRARLVEAGNRDEVLTGAELRRQLAEERAFFAEVVRRAGIEPQ